MHYLAAFLLVACATAPAPPSNYDAVAQNQLCAVVRSYAPLAYRWVLHGCPATPAPLPASARPCRVTWHHAPDGAADLTYDDRGRLETVSNRLLTWRYQYDGDLLAAIVIGDKRTPLVFDGDTMTFGDQRFTLAPRIIAFSLAPLALVLRYEGERLIEVTNGDSTQYQIQWDHGRITKVDALDGEPSAYTYSWVDRHLVGASDRDGATKVEYCSK